MFMLEDVFNLFILRVCIKEIMWWKFNVLIGVVYEMEVDDVYNGYFIFKGICFLFLDW